MLKNLFLGRHFTLILVGLAIVFLLAQMIPFLFALAKLATYGFIVAVFIDLALLFNPNLSIKATRLTPEKLSNGDENPIQIELTNHYALPLHVTVIEELPPEFQLRNVRFYTYLLPAQLQTLHYTIRPTQRGAYRFGNVNVYAQTLLGLVKRRFTTAQPVSLPVYPSYIQMRRYELMAISNRLHELGVKKVRKLGHSLEFEQIKEYVPGDDYRTINWNATARKAALMVNQYQDEKSQEVYSIIDKGRVMKMPFNRLSLLDYAINAALVISNIAIKRGDKAGLVTFSNEIDNVLPAGNRGKQMSDILELLYSESTQFLESDYQKLFVALRRRLNRRCLLLLYTNFESMSALQRQLPYLRRLAKQHLLVVVFFENTELTQLLNTIPDTLPEVYEKTIAEKFAFEKKLIVKELQTYGIHTILTPPEQLTVNTINKYLELKNRGMI
ncbi:MAG TPA: DUF58 domain-containing protein [Chitinophagales bacterium]|nr:DUF58 domain-containing protein [Chitinophagales bacterium]HRK25835.1 DUF58 domain-containing protein [Chitinophagales bacterium]